VIGKDALSRDLPLYLPGLSTTLAFASLSVRTPFLELLETHLLKLDSRALRPAFKAVILSLLPGLEEETSEDFERTLKLFDGFKEAIRPSSTEVLGHNHSSGDAYFWQCFFLASITSNGRRLGALAYLIRHLPKLGQALSGEVSVHNESHKDDTKQNLAQLAELVTSPEPGLLLRCFAAGLADEQILIQRGFLDLLVTHLPLHADVLQKKVKVEDLQLLVTAAVGVVTRRDMSLNRRLWTWLLGPETLNLDNEGLESPVDIGEDRTELHASPRTRYFESFGLRPLTRALLETIRRDTANPVDRARPFRICLSLMDRWEIGGLVVPDIFLPVVSSVRKFKDIAATKADFTEVLRSASVFFDGVESGLIWGEIVGLIVQALGIGKTESAESTDNLCLVSFIIAHFNIREEEMLLVHAPLTVLTILMMLEETEGAQSTDAHSTVEISRLALSIAVELMDLIPERAFQTQPATSQSTTATESCNLTNSEVLQTIRAFYVQGQGNLDTFPPPLISRDMSKFMLRGIGAITCRSLCDPVSSAEAGLSSRLLVTMLAKIPPSRSLEAKRILSSMHNRLCSPTQLPFQAFSSIISIATSIYSAACLTPLELSSLVDPLVRLAWTYLSASHPKYHVETVRCLWQLQTTLTLSNHEIEASICSVMIEHEFDGTFALRDADPGRNFSILWTHTLQDNAAHLDRRSSKASNYEVKGPARLSGIGNYEVMLSRPLFLLLDALLDERTQLFMTVRTWIQNLVGIDKYITEIFFFFLQRIGLTIS
jgi:hypothetical protein